MILLLWNRRRLRGFPRGFAPLPDKLAGTPSCSLSPRALNAYIPLAVRKDGYGDKRTSE